MHHGAQAAPFALLKVQLKLESCAFAAFVEVDFYAKAGSASDLAVEMRKEWSSVLRKDRYLAWQETTKRHQSPAWRSLGLGLGDCPHFLEQRLQLLSKLLSPQLRYLTL